MLWYKAWLETRWRFLIGLGLLMCSAGALVFTYPEVMKLMALVPAIDVSGEIGRRIREAAELAREYRGYVWSQGFRQNLPQILTLFAVLLGTGGLVSQGSAGALFTLSMPTSRRRVIGVRAGTGLAELLVLAVVPSLLIPLLSPAIGESYSVASALVHSACLFIVATAFFSLTFLLSTVFPDLWRPLLIALAIAIVLSLCEQVVRGLSAYGIFAVMSGEVYFRTGSLPWGALLATGTLSFGMLYAAATRFARRDF